MIRLPVSEVKIKKRLKLSLPVYMEERLESLKEDERFVMTLLQSLPIRQFLTFHTMLALLGIANLVLASLLGFIQPYAIKVSVDTTLLVLQVLGFGLITLSFLPIKLINKIALAFGLFAACGFMFI